MTTIKPLKEAAIRWLIENRIVLDWDDEKLAESVEVSRTYIANHLLVMESAYTKIVAVPNIPPSIINILESHLIEMYAAEEVVIRYDAVNNLILT